MNVGSFKCNALKHEASPEGHTMSPDMAPSCVYVTMGAESSSEEELGV